MSKPVQAANGSGAKAPLLFKVCTDCGRSLTVGAFYTNIKMKDGRLAQCKPCVQARRKAEREAIRKDPVREAKYKTRHRRYYDKRKYGVTREELLKEQPRCFICRRWFHAMTPNRVVVDHCHTTGAVRGLLCHSCNVGLGRFRDDPVLVRRALNHLKRRA